MKNIKYSASLAAAFVLAPLAFAPLQAQAVPLFGTNLVQYSILSGAAVTTGAGAKIQLLNGAPTATTVGAGSTSGGDVWGTAYTNATAGALNRQDAAAVNLAHNELASAITQVSAMTQTAGTQFHLSAEIVAMDATLTFLPGVYTASGITTGARSKIVFDGGGTLNPLWVFNINSGAASLTTGADATMSFINVVGPAAGVIWNATAITTGARSTLLGTTMSTTAYSDGALAKMPCGAIYSLTAAITTAAQSDMTTNGCMGSATWSVSQAGGLDAPAAAAAVPEPASYALLLAGLGLLGFKARRKQQQK